MKKFEKNHNIVLSVNSIEEYNQDKNWLFWEQITDGMQFFFGITGTENSTKPISTATTIAWPKKNA